MRIATFAITLGLAVLSTIALAQSVTYDYDRTANFSQLQDIRVDSRDRADRRAEPRAHCLGRRIPTDGKGLTKVIRADRPCADPDVLVAYHASFEKNLEISGVHPRVGAFWSRRPAGVSEGSDGSGRNACRRHRRRKDRRDRIPERGQQ